MECIAISDTPLLDPKHRLIPPPGEEMCVDTLAVQEYYSDHLMGKHGLAKSWMGIYFLIGELLNNLQRYSIAPPAGGAYPSTFELYPTSGVAFFARVRNLCTHDSYTRLKARWEETICLSNEERQLRLKAAHQDSPASGKRHDGRALGGGDIGIIKLCNLVYHIEIEATPVAGYGDYVTQNLWILEAAQKNALKEKGNGRD